MTSEARRRLLEAFRRRDLPGLLTLLVRPIRLVQFERVHIVRASMLDHRPLLDRLRARASGLSLRIASASDQVELARLFPRDPSRYLEPLRRGDVCMLIDEGGQAVAIGWVRFDVGAGVEELGCRLELPGGSCWGYDTYILPRHRGRGAFAALMWEMFNLIRERGRQTVHASINHLNYASLAAHERLGYSTVAVLDRFVLARLTVCRLSLPGRGRVWRWIRPDCSAILALSERHGRHERRQRRAG